MATLPAHPDLDQLRRQAKELRRAATAGDGPALARIRAVSEGYHTDWAVQFPRELRELGAKYVVDELRESGSGGFYRAHGAIRKLDRA